MLHSRDANRSGLCALLRRVCANLRLSCLFTPLSAHCRDSSWALFISLWLQQGKPGSCARGQATLRLQAVSPQLWRHRYIPCPVLYLYGSLLLSPWPENPRRWNRFQLLVHPPQPHGSNSVPQYTSSTDNYYGHGVFAGHFRVGSVPAQTATFRGLKTCTHTHTHHG